MFSRSHSVAFFAVGGVSYIGVCPQRVGATA